MDTGYRGPSTSTRPRPALAATRDEASRLMIGYAMEPDGLVLRGAARADQEVRLRFSKSSTPQALDQPIDVISTRGPLPNVAGALRLPVLPACALAQRQRGDPHLHDSGTVTHVAIYLGDDAIVHRLDGATRHMQHITAGYGWDRMTPGVVRPLLRTDAEAGGRKVLHGRPSVW